MNSQVQPGGGGGASQQVRASKVGSVIRGTVMRSSRRQSRRHSETNSRGGGESEADQLNMRIFLLWHLTQGEEGQIENTLNNFDEWNFDMNMVAEILDVHLLPIIFLKMTIIYDFVGSLRLDFDLMHNFTSHLQSS